LGTVSGAWKGRRRWGGERGGKDWRGGKNGGASRKMMWKTRGKEREREE